MAGSTASGGNVASGGSAGSSSGAGGSGGSNPNVIAPGGAWTDVTNNLPQVATGGGDVGPLAAQPGTGRMIVGVGGLGYFATDDVGATWFKLGSGINHRPQVVLFDPTDATKFWMSGIYGDGVFKTTDSGETMVRLGNITHNDAVGVDFSDTNRMTLVAGGHEAKQKVFHSTDAGATWGEIGATLPGDSGFSSQPLVISPQNFLIGAGKLYRSTDTGASWSVASSGEPRGQPLVASDGVIYWAAAQGVLVSHDQGASWDSYSGTVPSTLGTLTELPDGRILGLGSTHIMISADQGQTWQQVGEAMPYQGKNCGIYGFAYSVENAALFLNYNDCSGNVQNGKVFVAEWAY